LGLLRHGQTDWNINFLLQGVTDIPMNQTGIEQVKLAAQAIRAEDWDVVLTSPLSRARQTAEIIAEKIGFDKSQIIISHKILNGKIKIYFQSQNIYSKIKIDCQSQTFY
jgi:broad specificity phosphatase PhoE